MSPSSRSAASAALAACACFAGPADAALWSATNTVADVSTTTTMEISLTGDEITVGAQVDVLVPTGISNVVATPLNGASCVYLASSRTVRLIVMDAGLRPLPTWPRPACTIQFGVFRSTSTWFSMRNSVCGAADGKAPPCPVDEGYLTITR